MGDAPMVSARWRALLDERLDEATAALSAILGVRGLVLAGSLGRGEPWPCSDIDMLPIVAADVDVGAAIEQRQAALVDWWAASTVAQTLDVGWLRFTDREVADVVAMQPMQIADLMRDWRWFHGLDKAFGGRGVADPDGLAQRFATWATGVRFEPLVVAARVQQWRRLALEARAQAGEALVRGEPVAATLAVREAARALRLVLLEGWGERLGSMGREWTRFERIAARHGASEPAAQLARLADADAATALERAQSAPLWLQERIERTFAARQLIGEAVSAAENARDQLAAFAVHVPRRSAPPWGGWLAVPAPDLDARIAELDALLAH